MLVALQHRRLQKMLLRFSKKVERPAAIVRQSIHPDLNGIAGSCAEAAAALSKKVAKHGSASGIAKSPDVKTLEA